MPAAPTLTLNRDVFAAALDSALENYGLDSHSEYRLETFSEDGAQAISELVGQAFGAWRALSQPAGSELEVVAYPIIDESENAIIVAVRGKKGPQLCTLMIGADRLVDNQYERCGPRVLAEILTEILGHANRLLEQRELAPAVRG